MGLPDFEVGFVGDVDFVVGFDSGVDFDIGCLAVDCFAFVAGNSIIVIDRHQMV